MSDWKFTGLIPIIVVSRVFKICWTGTSCCLTTYYISRQLGQRLSDTSVGAPPSYEEATRDVEINVHDDRFICMLLFKL